MNSIEFLLRYLILIEPGSLKADRFPVVFLQVLKVDPGSLESLGECISSRLPAQTVHHWGSDTTAGNDVRLRSTDL